MNKLLHVKRAAFCLIWGISFLAYNESKAAAKPPVNKHKLAADTTAFSSFVVIDENEEALAGVTLLNKRTQQTATSDSLGTAKILAKVNDVITVSINKQIITDYLVPDTKRCIIILSSKNVWVNGLKKVIITNNIKLSRPLTAASTQAVYNTELIKMPVTSVKNAVVGKLAGVYTQQASGRPGADDVSLLLRGQTPTIIIDGIPRNMSLLDLEEVESVTVLKDALATAMFGLRASNGALVITTKKGVAGLPHISFTAQQGVQTSIKRPSFLNAYDYASLYNEALVNDGRSPIYSAADLDAYRSGSDPIGHPDVNWQDQIFDKSSIFSRYDVNIKGGDNVARYYVGLEYQNQQGDLKQSDINTYSTNNNYNNFTVRSNVDVNLTSKTVLGINLFGRIINNVAPGVGTDALFTSILNTPNLAYPVYNSNGSYGGTANYTNNIYAQSINSGYNLNYKRDVITDISLRRSLDELTKGLYAKALISSYSSLSENTNRSKTFATFLQINNGGTTTYQQFGTNGTQNNSTSISYQNRQMYYEGTIGYKRQFGLSGVDVQVKATSDNLFNDSDLSLNYYGGSAFVSYNYAERYSVEFAAGLNRTNRYPPGTPMGFFPAVGLSWNITKEKFMPKTNWLNDLKLFASYGKTGNDVAGYFIYNQYFTGGNSYYFSNTPTSYGGLTLNTLANTNITWEKANKFNGGVSAILFNKLSVQLEYYNNKYYDLLNPANVSSIIGIALQNQNIGINNYSGMELQLNWSQNINKFNYYITGNVSVQQSKVKFQNEVFRAYDYMSRTGQPVGQVFGYIADGLFQSQAQINSSAKIAGYNPVPGDIKYKDLNNDGVIDQFDQAAIGTTKPLITYGTTLGFSYGGFDMTMLIQGVANRNLLLTGNSVWEFQNNGFGQANTNNLNRWTPATAATATYPRVSVGTNVNNDIVSSFWMHSGDYVRLKNIELGYTITGNYIKRAHLTGIRLFISGTNLFTHSAYDVVDPETNGGGYPIQRVINGGINIKL